MLPRSQAAVTSGRTRTPAHLRTTPYEWFRRELATGNLPRIQTAAAELDTITLDDALTILIAMAHAGDHRYDRAAGRWVARLTLERQSGIETARTMLALVEVLPAAPGAVEPTLRRVARYRA